MLFNFFKKNSFAELESFYLAEELKKSSWMALAINQRTISESLLTKELVLTNEENSIPPLASIQMADIDSGIVQHVFLKKSKIFSGEILISSEEKKAKVFLNQLINSIIEKEIQNFTTAMNQSDFSPRQLEAEEKALEWIRVSFEVLTKGIIESLTNPDYLFQTTLFAGVNPKTKFREIRLITFNLDMTFLILEDNNLRVLIYNKIPNQKAEDLKPALIGDYSFRKREIFDHFIKLLSVISKGL